MQRVIKEALKKCKVSFRVEDKFLLDFFMNNNIIIGQNSDNLSGKTYILHICLVIPILMQLISKVIYILIIFYDLFCTERDCFIITFCIPAIRSLNNTRIYTDGDTNDVQEMTYFM